MTDGGAAPRLDDTSVLFSLALETGETVPWVLDVSSGTLRFTGGALELFGPEAGEGSVSTRSFFAVVHPDDRKRLDDAAATALRDGTDFSCEYRTLTEGRTRWLLARGRPVYDGGTVRLLGVTSEITDLRRAEAALRDTQERMQALLSDAPIMLLAFDRRGRVTVAEGRELTTLGFDPQAVVGGPLNAVLGEVADTATEAVAAGRALTIRTGLGDRIYDVSVRPSLGAEEAGLVVATDVTERAEAEQELRQQMLHDPLTGLANREHMHQFLDECHRRDGQLAVFYIDLDDFKTTNDTHGHDVGDALLAAVGRRLQAAVRTQDLVARVGGDEFVVVCTDMDQTQARDIADRIVTELARPFVREGLQSSGASVGVAVVPCTELTPAEWLRRADEAMYAAKRSGRGRWCMAGS